MQSCEIGSFFVFVLLQPIASQQKRSARNHARTSASAEIALLSILCNRYNNSAKCAIAIEQPIELSNGSHLRGEYLSQMVELTLVCACFVFCGWPDKGH